jgi:PAS domain S-box-containing protein
MRLRIENLWSTTANRPANAPPLHESEQVVFLNSILESSTEYSIVAKDLDGTILAWNEGARRVYGYEPQDVIGKAKALILHDPDDVASGRAEQILLAARQTGTWEGELPRVRKNGTRFTAHVTITLRRDATGDYLGFTMISRDLTYSHQIERELRESQEYNRGLIESNIDALMTTDPLGLITDVNRQMCEMTGVGRDQLIGTPFKDYFTDSRRAEYGIRKVLIEDRVTDYELTMRSSTGKETVVSYNATTFRSTDGRLKGVFSAARDITDQKGLEEELRQTQNYTRGLIEASVDALVTVDPGLRVTDVNEQTVRMTGYSREELIGTAFPDYFTDAERAMASRRRWPSGMSPTTSWSSAPRAAGDGRLLQRVHLPRPRGQRAASSRWRATSPSSGASGGSSASSRTTAAASSRPRWTPS